MPFRFAIVAVISGVFLVACQPTQQTTRNKQPASKIDPCKQANPPKSCGLSSGGGTSTDGGDDNDDPVNLAPYLFSLAEAQAIKDIVEPYEDISGGGGDYTSDSKFGNMERFVQDFVDDAMRIKGLDPGRSFKVTVISDPSVNAAADHLQNIIINAGAIKQFSSKSMLSTLCHEIAHSTKNHSYKGIVLEKKDGIEKKILNFEQEYSDYINDTYDSETEVYRHNKTKYTRLAKLWKVIAEYREPIWKRDESEADIVGGMICGHLGMSSTEYKNAFDAGIGKLSDGAEGESITADDLKDGDELDIKEDESDALFYFLFYFDSHPKHKERSAQLTRVEKAIAKHFAKNDLYKDWSTGYKDAGGLNLTGLEPDFSPKMIVKDLGDGRVVKIPRNPTSCRHKRPLH